MIFRSVLGTTYQMEVPLDRTFREITAMFNEQHRTNYTIIYVVMGHTISPSSTPIKESLTNDSEVFIVTSEAKTPPQPVAEEPDADPAPAAAAAAPTSSTPAPEQPLEPAYTAHYTGQQLKEAMKKNSFVLLNVISMIGRQNPFLLSYLVVNPVKAQEHIMMTLDQPEFILAVRGQSVADDPIKPYLMHPSGTNGHQVDQDNLRYIIGQCPNFISTEESLARAKDTYLLLDRDIRKTITALNAPDASGTNLVGTV